MYIASIGIARTSIALDDTASESSLKTAGVTLIFITCESLPLAPCLLLVELICAKSFLRAETYDGGIQDTHRSFRGCSSMWSRSRTGSLEQRPLGCTAPHFLKEKNINTLEELVKP